MIYFVSFIHLARRQSLLQITDCTKLSKRLNRKIENDERTQLSIILCTSKMGLQNQNRIDSRLSNIYVQNLSEMK